MGDAAGYFRGVDAGRNGHDVGGGGLRHRTGPDVVACCAGMAEGGGKHGQGHAGAAFSGLFFFAFCEIS